MRNIDYNRQNAVLYAKKWAYRRNPAYFAFDEIGGDCTNFVSQCLYAGAGVQNYEKVFGWYYISPNNRTPSWTGVEYLYNFLIGNTSVGPYAGLVYKSSMQLGDIIQLGNESGRFYHSLVVTDIADDELFVSAHTNDVYNKRLSLYNYDRIRYIHINGVRTY